MRPSDLLRPEKAGLYCPPGDFFIDPVRTVARAVITHGHSDHARPGHSAVLATRETLAFMAARYGEKFAGARQAVAYGETNDLGGVRVRLVPAGHVLGSAQVVVEMGGTRIVVSGDYKRRADPTCPAFEPVPCDVFVTEATFALPVFRHPETRAEIAKLLRSLAVFPDRTHLVGAYSLGKTQRVIAEARAGGFDGPILLHDAMLKLTALYQSFGVDLGDVRPVSAAADLAGAFVIAPPASPSDTWAGKVSDPVTAFASGWMRVRAQARRRGITLPLVISDHADWDELTQTLEELRPGEVWITHGREDALSRWCDLARIPARALSLVGYDSEGGGDAA